MNEISAIATFLSGLGLGGIITFIVKHSLEQKSKIKEMWLMDYKATCDSLLEAYKQAALNGSQEAAKEFAYCEMKLNLYANDAVLNAVQALKDSQPGTEQRDIAQINLLKAMRNDLGLV